MPEGKAPPSAPFVAAALVPLGLCATGLITLRLAGPPGQHPLAGAGGFALAFAGMVLTARSGRWNGHNPFIVLIAAGFLFRLCFFGFPPSDDFNRYLWEGRVQTLGFNPYTHSPDHPALEPLRDAVWEGINHKGHAAIYPPGAQLVLRWMARWYPSPLPFRLLMLAAESATMLLLAWILGLFARPRSYLAYYACNPLPILFVMGELHLDGLQTPALLFALALAVSGKRAWAFLALGTAAVVKYVAAALAPALVRLESRRAVLFLAAPFGVFLLYHGTGWAFFDSLLSFSTEMSFNSLVYRELKNIVPGWAGVLCLGAFVCLGTAHLVLEPRLEKNFLVLSFLLLVFAPTVHPWYLVPVCALWAIHPGFAFGWLQLAHFVLLQPQYARFWESGVWREFPWSAWWIWGGFLGIWAMECLRGGKKEPGRRYARVEGVSVVIPVLNEAARLQPLLDDLKRDSPGIPREVVVVDGGSTDDTHRICRHAGVRLLQASRRGRGYQVQLGIENSGRDVVAVLHADCRIPAEMLRGIIDSLNARPEALGGWHAMRYQHRRGPALRTIEVMNAFRVRCLGIAFGDQLQFFRREPAKALGLSLEMPLMEDVELSMFLKEHGPALQAPGRVRVSARKWSAGRVPVHAWLVIRLVVFYLVGRRFGLLAPGSDYFAKHYYAGRRD